MLKSKSYNYPLEGLRGMCALSVALIHVITGNTALINITSSLWLATISFAHTAVLIFFVLSGYVIGLNYPNERMNVKQYLKKRFIRIYPIYLIVVLFCWTLEPNLTSARIFSSLFLLPGLKVELVTNVVLWSIQYEVLFYLFFIVQTKTKKGIIYSIIAFAVLSFVATINNQFPKNISGYSAGYCFWLSGLLVSRFKPLIEVKKEPLLCLILLLIVYNELAIGKIVLNGLNFTQDNFNIVSFADLTSLPICFLIIQIFTNRENIYSKLLFIVVFTLPLIMLGYLIYLERVLENIHWRTALLITTISIFTLIFKQRVTIFNKLVFLGSISYTLYIIHYPIAYAIKEILGRSILSFAVWLLLSITMSYLIEIKVFKNMKLALL